MDLTILPVCVLGCCLPFHEISGEEEGAKFDLIQTLDLDGDGDLDIVTCEERDNLGVIWYENPTRTSGVEAK